MIVVFDASTVVGAVLSADGIPRRALVAAQALCVTALSNEVYAELVEVLSRPKFARVPHAERTIILDLLSATAAWSRSDVAVDECRDPGDNKYLELAAAAKADVIVSSDEDLLVLDPWRGIRIVRAREFLEMVQAEPRR